MDAEGKNINSSKGYCKTGKFHDRLISRIRESDRFATGKFRESGDRGGFQTE